MKNDNKGGNLAGDIFTVSPGYFVVLDVFKLDKKMKYIYNERKLNEWLVNYESFYKAGTKIEYS